jgi:hypothetical protein
MNYRGILFDKDGTLLDFNRSWLPVYRHAALVFADGDAHLAERLLSDHGYDAGSSRFIGGSLLAAGNNRQIAVAWAELAGSTQPADELGRRLSSLFGELAPRHATAVDGLVDTLRTLRDRGLKLGVATADSRRKPSTCCSISISSPATTAATASSRNPAWYSPSAARRDSRRVRWWSSATIATISKWAAMPVPAFASAC